MSKFFFATAPLTIFFGLPWLTLSLMLLALVMLGLRAAMNGGVKLSFGQWWAGYRAALTRNLTATIAMTVSVWLVPMGLSVAGVIDGKWVIVGALASYFCLGRLSIGVGQAHAAWRALQLGDVKEVLGLTEGQMAAVGVARGALGAVIVTGFPASKIMDITALETRLRVLWPEMELGQVTKRAITFTPCTAQTEETRSAVGASRGLVGVMTPTDSSTTSTTVPSFDFSDGPATHRKM